MTTPEKTKSPAGKAVAAVDDAARDAVVAVLGRDA